MCLYYSYLYLFISLYYVLFYVSPSNNVTHIPGRTEEYSFNWTGILFSEVLHKQKAKRNLSP